MVRTNRQDSTRRAVIFTACGGAILLILLLMLILRYHTMEDELDRMLAESLTAHTVEAGEGAGYLLHYAETTLRNTDLLIREDPRDPDKDWVIPVVKTFDLADDRMELNYLDLEDLSSTDLAAAGPELLQQVLAGKAVVSGLIAAPQREDSYVAAVLPMVREGQVEGVLLAKVDAVTLLHQGTSSTFFHSVHSVIASEDGKVIYGSSPDTEVADLSALGAKNGTTPAEAQAFAVAYGAQEAGSFSYDPVGGRFYVAWAPVGYHGWRVVQFSQSPNVHIESRSAVQTVIMLSSLVVCVILAVLAWHQRAKLAEEKMRYNTLAEFRDTLLFEYDCDSDSLYFTSNARDTLALEDLHLTGISNTANCFPVFHPDDIENVRRILGSASEMVPGQIGHDRLRLKRLDGEYLWYRSQYKAIFSSDGKAEQVVGTLTDISSQIDREIELRKQAQQDPLTGLYNRAGVKLINARLEQISRGVLFMLDLDDFKSINDTYGHAAGDRLLIAIGQILTETFRTDDIVARVGGDEFVVFLSGSDNKGTAEQKAQELLDRVHALKLEGIDTQASVSIGAARSPVHGRTYEALSMVADEALYEVKKGGKSDFVLK